MPFLNGKKVTNDEWVAAMSGEPVGWMEVAGYQYGDEQPTPVEPEQEPEAEKAPPKQRKARAKVKQAEAAVLAATGESVDLDDATLDVSGITDLDAEPEGK